MRDRLRNVIGIDPVETIATVAQRNYQRWRAAQDDILRTLMDATVGSNRPANDDKSVEQSGPPPN